MTFLEMTFEGGWRQLGLNIAQSLICTHALSALVPSQSCGLEAALYFQEISNASHESAELAVAVGSLARVVDAVRTA